MNKEKNCRICSRSFLLRVILVAFVLSTLFACNQIAKGESQASTVNIPNRIVVFPLFAEEILLEMVGPDRIVYVGHTYWDDGTAYSPSMVQTKGIAGASWQNSNEIEILHLAPDLIICGRELEEDYENVFPALAAAGIPILFLDEPTSISDIIEAIFLLGRTVNAQIAANQMAFRMKDDLKQIDTLVSAIPESERISAAYAETNQRLFRITAEAAGINIISPTYADAEFYQLTWDYLFNADVVFFAPYVLDTDGSIYDVGNVCEEEKLHSFLQDPLLYDVHAIKSQSIYPLSLHESQYIVQSIKRLFCIAYQK